eukprot:338877-Prymnesium_polylepis.1
MLGVGSRPPPFLFDAIPTDRAHSSWRRPTAAVLFGHVAISYAISSVALGTAIQRLYLRHAAPHEVAHTSTTTTSGKHLAGAGAAADGGRAGDESAGVCCVAMGDGAAAPALASDSRRCRRRLEWCCLTTGMMMCVWLLANAAPFFAGLVDLIGSLNLCTFFLPCLFLRRAHELTHTPMPH